MPIMNVLFWTPYSEKWQQIYEDIANDKYCYVIFIWLKSTYYITFLNKPQTQTLGIFPLFWNLLASSSSNGASDNNRSNLSSAGKMIPLAFPNKMFRYILQIQGCHGPSDLDIKAWRIKKICFHVPFDKSIFINWWVNEKLINFVSSKNIVINVVTVLKCIHRLVLVSNDRYIARHWD